MLNSVVVKELIMVEELMALVVLLFLWMQNQGQVIIINGVFQIMIGFIQYKKLCDTIGKNMA